MLKHWNDEIWYRKCINKKCSTKNIKSYIRNRNKKINKISNVKIKTKRNAEGGKKGNGGRGDSFKE